MLTFVGVKLTPRRLCFNRTFIYGFSINTISWSPGSSQDEDDSVYQGVDSRRATP